MYLHGSKEAIEWNITASLLKIDEKAREKVFPCKNKDDGINCKEEIGFDMRDYLHPHLPISQD